MDHLFYPFVPQTFPCFLSPAAVRESDQHGESGELCERRAQLHAEGNRKHQEPSQGRSAEGSGARRPAQGLRRWRG